MLKKKALYQYEEGQIIKKYKLPKDPETLKKLQKEVKKLKNMISKFEIN